MNTHAAKVHVIHAHVMTDKERRQEHFNIVWQHFVVEKAPASFDISGCLYAGPDGAVCAFSLLLTEDERADAVRGHEGYGAEAVIYTLRLRRFYNRYGMPDPWYDRLQYCHDSAALNDGFTNAMADNLCGLATDYGLTVPEPVR